MTSFDEASMTSGYARYLAAKTPWMTGRLTGMCWPSCAA
jgi:hypothetical protein